MRGAERRQGELGEHRPARREIFDRVGERMGGRHLVVAVRADDEETRQIGTGQEEREQAQRRRVRPLEVIEEEHQGVIRMRERAEKPLEHPVEAILGLGRVEGRDRRLRPDQASHGWDDVHDHLAARPHGGQHALPPGGDLLVGPREEMPHETLEGLPQRRVGHVPRELVELAGDEVTSALRQGAMELLDERGLADTGVSRDQHQLGGAGRHPLEGLEQSLHLRFSSIQPLRNDEAVTDVVLSQRKIGDLASAQPRGAATGQIRRHALGALVAVLGALRQQSHDEIRERTRDPGVTQMRRDRRLRDMPVDHLERVERLERDPAGEHLVIGDAEGVEIGAVVDVAVHAAGLFRRHVGDRALEQMRVLEMPLLLGRHP